MASFECPHDMVYSANKPEELSSNGAFRSSIGKLRTRSDGTVHKWQVLSAESMTQCVTGFSATPASSATLIRMLRLRAAA
jgi:hypothetical protein